MPRLTFTRGEQVWWTTGMEQQRAHYGVLKTISGSWLTVLEYNEFMQPADWREIARSRLYKFMPNGLSKLNEAIKLINIGRLQYNQHFFRSPKHKKTEWRKGYERYKKLCREYNVPVNPKRPVPDLPE